MYRAKPFLDKESLLSSYYSYIHSYLNYTNLAWGSTYRTNLKKLHSQQKHAIRIVHNRQNLNIQKNFLYQQTHWIYINLMYWALLCLCIGFIQKHLLLFSVEGSRRFLISIYSTRSSTLYFSKPKLKLTETRCRISIRGPTMWNDFIEDCLKSIEKLLFSKVKWNLSYWILIMR